MQELYNRMRKHLLTQNQRSSYSDIACAYRGDNGLKCAVGVLIPDDKYYPGLEGKAAHDPCVLRAIGLNEFAFEAIMLRDVQRVHDLYDPSEWERELDKVAAFHDLTVERDEPPALPAITQQTKRPEYELEPA